MPVPAGARNNPCVYASAFRCALRVLFALSLSGIAFAQTQWPERPIQLIVPFPAGGAVDVIARSFAEVFGELLHQTVVVIARDGASGTIGTAAVAAAKADGYTLAFTPNRLLKFDL